ncbi:acireductone dioxygenase-like [Paramacrobiotus metropolitanus]|uniref:acireductone dioxygenase-like n=1 Tax=Paramacrobiotus metropolitanus TaxID=2943436 RepID=UPI00244573BC|nr:acireductone dioxygenase-like [Paramacrobiotus metropolitanus]
MAHTHRQPQISARIYWLRDQSLDQAPNESKKFDKTPEGDETITPEELFRRTGVLYRKVQLTISAEEQEETLKRSVPNLDQYDYRDIIDVSPKGLGDKFDALMRMFYDEHIHGDDEVRFVLDGNGYWDVRDVQTDQWIRLVFEKGDFINIPKGAYHRFSLDSNQYMKCMRMFAGSPVWTAFYRNKDGDTHPARKQYVEQVLRRQQTTA